MDVMDTLAVDQCGGFLVVVLCEAAISSFTGLLAVVLFCKLLTHRNSALASPYKSCFSDCALRRETVWSVTVAMHWGERVHDAEQLHISLQRAAGSDQIKVHGCTTVDTGSWRRFVKIWEFCREARRVPHSGVVGICSRQRLASS